VISVENHPPPNPCILRPTDGIGHQCKRSKTYNDGATRRYKKF